MADYFYSKTKKIEIIDLSDSEPKKIETIDLCSSDEEAASTVTAPEARLFLYNDFSDSTHASTSYAISSHLSSTYSVSERSSSDFGDTGYFTEDASSSLVQRFRAKQNRPSRRSQPYTPTRSACSSGYSSSAISSNPCLPASCDEDQQRLNKFRTLSNEALIIMEFSRTLPRPNVAHLEANLVRQANLPRREPSDDEFSLHYDRTYYRCHWAAYTLAAARLSNLSLSMRVLTERFNENPTQFHWLEQALILERSSSYANFS